MDNLRKNNISKNNLRTKTRVKGTVEVTNKVRLIIVVGMGTLLFGALLPTNVFANIKARDKAKVDVEQQTLETPKIQGLTQGLAVTNKSIEQVDNDAERINSLKRRLEIEKIQADIEHARGDKKHDSIGQTTATNIVLTGNGSSLATLQFVDGSFLDVEVGSKVGKYFVAGITLAGVTLGSGSCKRGHCGGILIKRSYGREVARKDSNDKDTPKSYRPTPILNDGGENVVVPPIVSNR